MNWPTIITAHADNPHTKPPFILVGPEGVVWRPAFPENGTPYRTCSWCGSIHPEDLFNAVEAGAELGGSDWKYGWPHKFYVHGVPNPLAGQVVRCGSISMHKSREPTEEERAHYSNWREEGDRRVADRMAPAPATLQAKWYNEHIKDFASDQAALAQFTEWLDKHSDILFNLDPEKGLGYRAPARGYQRLTKASRELLNRA